MEPTPTRLPRSVWVNHSEFERAVHAGRTTARGVAVDTFRQDPKAHGAPLPCDGRGSLHTGKQQANPRKLGIWQLSSPAAVGDGVTGLRVIDGDAIFGGAERDRDPQRNGE